MHNCSSTVTGWKKKKIKKRGGRGNERTAHFKSLFVLGS
jgi:hypothetical protein